MAETLAPANQLSTETLTKIVDLLKQGKSQADILKEVGSMGMEPLNAGIIRTRKGALMVRVSDDRWPIAMYKKDWKILLSKVPAIEEALEKLNILEENPEPTPRQKGELAAA